MALFEHGAVTLWYCVGMVLFNMALFEHGAVSLWPCVGMVLCHHGTV
jgi:hypothetical protein